MPTYSARIVLMLAAGLVACSTADRAPAAARSDQIAQEVDRRRVGLMTAIEQRDVDQMAGFFSDSPDAAFAGGGSMVTSRREFLARYRDVLGALRAVSIDFGQSKLAILAPDVAVLTAQARVMMTDTTGRTFERRHAWTMVWILEGREWKILHANQSYPAPGPLAASP